jgi:asparagine synthase (glutamine-hydrolysing)
MHLEDGIGLGIQRLRVIDLETGDQPIFNEDQSVVVVLNGEIYNYRELRHSLMQRGHHLVTQGDTEVIVHLYEDYGDACVEHLHGMFAFALWDSNKQRLLLARDRIGKKPLIYAQRGGDLWFGSEIPAVLKASEIDRTVDVGAIDSYLRYQYVPYPDTAFRELKKLPPAHTLVWEEGRASVQRYWKLSYAEPASSISDEDAQEEIRRRLLRATELRLRSDVPLGAFLSGGIDSGAVVAAMAKQSTTPVKTFTIGFDVEGFDETRYAREVAQLYDTDHHEFVVSADAVSILPKLVSHFGEPFADNSAVPTYYVAEMAAQHVTVALNGDGGDENFGGYGRYLRSRLGDRLAQKPRVAQAAARAIGVALQTSHATRFSERLDLETRLGRMPPDERHEWRMAYFTPVDQGRLYTDEFRREVASRSSSSVIAAAFADSDADDEVNRLIDVDARTYLPNALLVKMDITSMAHSLEVRSPLLDHTLMEFAASLPGSFKVADGVTKKVFREALRPWLPPSILDRPKQGFGSPASDWFRGSLRGMLSEVLLDPASIARGWFREDAVRSLVDDHVAHRADNTTKLWALLQLELWLRTFVDERRPQTLPIRAA